MTRTKRPALLRMLLASAFLALTSCGHPIPTCSAAENSYTICDEDAVYECPQGTPAQLAAKKVITDDCNKQADATRCILNAKFEMYPTTLKANCKGGGQVCVESHGAGVTSASCQPKP